MPVVFQPVQPPVNTIMFTLSDSAAFAISDRSLDAIPCFDSRSVPHIYIISVTVSLPLPLSAVYLSLVPATTAVLSWALLSPESLQPVETLDGLNDDRRLVRSMFALDGLTMPPISVPPPPPFRSVLTTPEMPPPPISTAAIATIMPIILPLPPEALVPPPPYGGCEVPGLPS